MGIMVVMMIAFLVVVPSHMGLGGGHQHGQGNAASQGAESRAGQDPGIPAETPRSGHSH